MGGRLPALLESHDHHGGEGLPGVQTQAAVFRGRGAQVLRGAGAQPERTGKETDGPTAIGEGNRVQNCRCVAMREGILIRQIDRPCYFGWLFNN